MGVSSAGMNQGADPMDSKDPAAEREKEQALADARERRKRMARSQQGIIGGALTGPSTGKQTLG